MPRSIKRLSGFWSELKRRKVIKVVAMYAATAFIILEVVDIVSPALHLPDWTVSLVILLLAVGFPIAVILSWIFDMTPEGFMKTNTIDKAAEAKADSVDLSKEKTSKRGFRTSDLVVVILLLVVGILLYPKIFSKDKFEDIREEDGRISIAVMPFQNLTNDTLWNVWQVGIQNELITNLSNSTDLSIRQYQTMQEILQGSSDQNYATLTPSTASEITRKLEATTFIQGSIIAAGDHIRLSAHLIDASNEEVFKSFQINGSSEGDIFYITDSLSRLVQNYLEIKVLQQNVVYDLRSGISTNSADAYRSYIEGLNLFFAQEVGLALDRLKESVRLDPGFFAAHEWLLTVYNSHGFNRQDFSQIEHARELLQKIMNWDTNKLSRMEQLSLNMIIAQYIDKNPLEYISLCRQMLEYDPQQRVIWFKLGATYNSIGQHENAIAAFEKAVEISNQWEVSDQLVRTYKQWGNAYYYLGNYHKEMEVYSQALSHFPNEPEITINIIRSALAVGDTLKVNEYLPIYRSERKNKRFWSEAGVNHRLAHQYAQAGLLEEAEGMWNEILRLEPNSSYHERCFAEFLILNDLDYQKGLDLINGILKENPDYYDILYFKGVGLLRLGKTEEALEILQAAWDKRFTYRHDHMLAIQEARQALSEQTN